jgi:hypothetical protein
MIAVEIHKKIESSNLRDKQHWSQRREERNIWYLLLRMKLLPRTPPNHKVKITIISHRNRLLDFGNLVAACKYIPDCLKQLGHIKDDSPHWFDCDYQQRQVHIADERTEILIHDEVPA